MHNPIVTSDIEYFFFKHVFLLFMHLSIPFYYLVLVMNGNSQLVESLSYEESVVLMCMCMVLLYVCMLRKDGVTHC